MPGAKAWHLKELKEVEYDQVELERKSGSQIMKDLEKFGKKFRLCSKGLDNA
jgi:hypothetical protein